jgi:short-subunit dehydrogenase
MSTFAFTLPEKQLTWLITGCSSGLGLALARTIIADGRHRVIATSRDPSRTPDLVAEVERSGNRWLPLDVTVPGVSEKLVTDLESEGVEIDVLVNNAGYCLFGPIETATDSEINKQLEIQFLGPLRLIRSVVPYMRERRFGVIVNMSSGAALMGNEGMGIYAGAKAGLDGMLTGICLMSMFILISVS